jgi:sigma-B regulation protein RsbU (phosphoserine phosphatase)
MPVALVWKFYWLRLQQLLGYDPTKRVVKRRDPEFGEIIEGPVMSAWPEIPGYQMALATRLWTGGGVDCFRICRRSISRRKHVFFVMADIARKGFISAVLMAEFQRAARALAEARLSLDELAARMNRWCWDRREKGRRFPLAFFADLDLDSGTMTYVRAGGLSPMLRRQGGSLERLDRAGLPLGDFADSLYGIETVGLEHGDALVILTNGFVEAVNQEGESYGEERVLGDLRLTHDAQARGIFGRIRESMLSFSGFTRQTNDCTFLILTRNPKAA